MMMINSCVYRMIYKSIAQVHFFKKKVGTFEVGT